MPASPQAKPAVEPREPLFADLGALSWPITTRQPFAQAYFDQGIRWAWAFNHSAARRAFREAQRQDPTCAMCYWGEAFVLGPNINAPMEAAAREPAIAAAKKASELAEGASPKERAIIEATVQRYSDNPKADQAGLNKAFAAALAKAHAAYPEDQHLAVLYVEAVMDTTPWDYWQARRQDAEGRDRSGDPGGRRGAGQEPRPRRRDPSLHPFDGGLEQARGGRCPMRSAWRS